MFLADKYILSKGISWGYSMQSARKGVCLPEAKSTLD
jgi:hypothetical protein